MTLSGKITKAKKGWGPGSSHRAPQSEHKALISNPSTAIEKKKIVPR
jgi:hypothetical protein